MDNEMYHKHFQNVKRETNNPNILNDVVNREGSQYLGRKNKMETEQSGLTQVEEVSRDSIDGKTWQNNEE